MKRSKRIEKILQKHLSDFTINVIDNSHSHRGHNNFDGTRETHIILEINNHLIKSINRLEIHKKINFLLKEEFEMGLHSLQIKII